MKKFYLYNNPYLAAEYSISIDFDTGIVFYKTNMQDGARKDYQSLFLLSKEALISAQEALSVIDNWQSQYGDDTQLMIDGYHWSIEVENGSVIKYKGRNAKPKDYDYMINVLETLLQKSLGGAIEHLSADIN